LYWSFPFFIVFLQSDEKNRLMKKTIFTWASAMGIALLLTLGSCGGKTETSVAEERAEMEEDFGTDNSEVDDEVDEWIEQANAVQDFQKPGITALGIGFENGNVLVNLEADESVVSLEETEELKDALTHSIQQLPTQNREDMQCIPNAGYQLVFTYAGKQTGKTATVVFTIEELQALLY